MVRGGAHAVVCVGETLEQRESGEAEEFVRDQLERPSPDSRSAFTESVIVAYEPLWAIGTGVNATAEQVRDMTAFVRGVVRSLGFGAPTGALWRLGEPRQRRSLVRESDVDGFLGRRRVAQSGVVLRHSPGV